MTNNLAKLAEQDKSQESPRPLMREMPPADPFPMDALGILKSAAEAIQDKTKAPSAICGQSVLAAAALVVQPLRDIELPNGQTRPISECFMIVAETGERKSSCDSEAQRPINSYVKTLRERYTPEFADYLNKKEAWDTARGQIKTQAKKKTKEQIKDELDALGIAPEQPLTPVIVCADMTVEGLCKLMMNGQPSIGFFTSEAGQFIGGHGMSNDHKTKTASILSLLWDGAPIDRVRSGDGYASIAGKRVTASLMAQPDIAAVMLTDPVLKSQGLLSRFLVTSPESTSGTRLWQEPSAETENTIKRYEAHLLDILSQSLPLVEGKRNELAPPPMQLSVEAYKIWVPFHDHIENGVGSGKPLASIRGLANKLPEHAVRLAAIHTLISDPEALTIPRSALEAGIMLAGHYANEALRLFEASTIDRKLLMAQTLLAWLLAGWTEDVISLPDVYQKGPKAIRDKRTASEMISILEEHGWLVPAGSGIVAGESRRDTWRIVKGV